MFWSIHVLNADTLVLRPPTPQSIKANTKPLVISFQPNIPEYTLSWNNYPWRSCWFQLWSKSLATFGRLLGRRGHTIMKSHFYFRILASWKVNFVWLTIISLLHIEGFLHHWIWRRYSTLKCIFQSNPPLCTKSWAACQPWLVEGWRLGNLVLELN
jgi:hypothetical protein